jgi:hypothetical protein
MLLSRAVGAERAKTCHNQLNVTVLPAISMTPFKAQGSKHLPPPSGERVWSLDKGWHRYSCELRPRLFGVEVELRCDWDMYSSRRFPTRASALGWAEAERRALVEAD